jgi:uncharacterized peroxidase-related enzyme
MTPFIETIPPERADGAVAAMYLRQQASWGFIPNYAKVFCHRPEVMARWGALLAEIKRPMDKRRFELATFVAACELRNSACALAHGRALREFLSDAQIAAVAQDRCAGVLDAADAALVAFARQVARDAAGVTAEQVAGLKAHGFTDAEVFDIATTAAGRAFFTKVLDALGVLIDSPFLAFDPMLRDTLTVGRPIDTRECETMPVAQSAPA